MNRVPLFGRHAIVFLGLGRTGQVLLEHGCEDGFDGRSEYLALLGRRTSGADRLHQPFLIFFNFRGLRFFCQVRDAVDGLLSQLHIVADALLEILQWRIFRAPSESR